MHESECSFGAKAHASLPANTTAQCRDLEISDNIIFLSAVQISTAPLHISHEIFSTVLSENATFVSKN